MGRGVKKKYIINYVLPMGLGGNICKMLAGKAESREQVLDNTQGSEKYN